MTTDFEELQRLTKIIPMTIVGGQDLSNGMRVTFVLESELVMILRTLVKDDGIVGALLAKVTKTLDGLLPKD